MIKPPALTPYRVGDLALWAEAVTGIKGWVGERTNEGDGVIWKSTRRDHVWRGLRANHRCASYLLGVISASVSGRLYLANPDHEIAKIRLSVSVDAVQEGMGKLDGAQALAAAQQQGGRASRAVMMAGAV